MFNKQLEKFLKISSCLTRAGTILLQQPLSLPHPKSLNVTPPFLLVTLLAGVARRTPPPPKSGVLIGPIPLHRPFPVSHLGSSGTEKDRIRQSVTGTFPCFTTGLIWALEIINQPDPSAAGGVVWFAEKSGVRVQWRGLWTGKWPGIRVHRAASPRDRKCQSQLWVL